MIRSLLQRCDELELWCMCSRSLWTRKWLLEQGNGNNETALHLAARHGHARVVAALLHAAGASAASLSLRVDRLGGTALHSAILKRRHGSIQSMLTHFVYSDTCTHVTLRKLLEHRNVNGHGALNLAVEEGDSLAVLLLLRARGRADGQRWECDAPAARNGQDHNGGFAVGLDAAVHLALRWAALTQPQGWQSILAEGIVPLLDLSDCESSLEPEKVPEQATPGDGQSVPVDGRLTACLLRARVNYGSSEASLLGMFDVEPNRAAQHDFPSELIVFSMKSFANATCFSGYLVLSLLVAN